jgi:hypothetical protein
MSSQNIEKYYKPNKKNLNRKKATPSSEEYDYSQNVNFAWKLFRYSDKKKGFLGCSKYHNLF